MANFNVIYNIIAQDKFSAAARKVRQAADVALVDGDIKAANQSIKKCRHGGIVDQSGIHTMHYRRLQNERI